MQEKKPLNIAIGKRIQQSREQAGLTQEELAEQIDRSPQFISTIERGLAGPSLETVLHLCEVLGTSTEWILRGRAPLSDSNLLAVSILEKLSALSFKNGRHIDISALPAITAAAFSRQVL